MMAFTAWSGRPMIRARSPWVQPRASSSSAMCSPGGNTSATRRLVPGMGRSPSVIVLDADDHQHVAAVALLDLQDQAELVVESDRVLMPPVPFELLEAVGLERPDHVLVRCIPDHVHPLAEGF